MIAGFARPLRPGFFLVFLAVFPLSPSADPSWNRDPLMNLNAEEVIEYWGYKGETHYVPTEDGYILGVHRIANPNSRYPPVLFQHGLLGNSDLWLLRGPKHDLTYLLADMGFDIWLSNSRGTTYSKNHTKLNPKTPKFWDFSWHEMGLYDMPAVIDHVLNVTGKPNLFYIGHSMGTTMFFVMASLRPEYNSKIVVQFSLAPVCYLTHMKANQILKPLAKNARLIFDTLRHVGWFEIFPRHDELSKLINRLGQDGHPLQKPFINSLFEFTGYDYKLLNKSLVPLFGNHFPSGASVKIFQHYSQIILKDSFRMYAYGPSGNMRKYNSIQEPTYNLSVVTAKVSLHFSFNDFLSSPKDVSRLASELPNVVGKFPIKFKLFNHVDFLWALNSKDLLYNDIIRVIQKYNQIAPSNSASNEIDYN